MAPAWHKIYIITKHSMTQVNKGFFGTLTADFFNLDLFQSKSIFFYDIPVPTQINIYTTDLITEPIQARLSTPNALKPAEHNN